MMEELAANTHFAIWSQTISIIAVVIKFMHIAAHYPHTMCRLVCRLPKASSLFSGEKIEGVRHCVAPLFASKKGGI